jgi:hypothetical protein
MDMSDLMRRLRAYAANHNLLVEERLGGGTDGEVWGTDVSTVLKVFVRKDVYENEIACYHRLEELGIQSIHGHAIPKLERFDDYLCLIELSTVKAPYLLDFGKAYLDRPHDFSNEAMEDWQSQMDEIWGEYWPKIRAIKNKLQSIGILYLDTKPGNVRPPDGWDNRPD